MKTMYILHEKTECNFNSSFKNVINLVITPIQCTLHSTDLNMKLLMNRVICADAQPSKSDKAVVERPLWQELSFWFHCDFEIKGNYTIIQNIFCYLFTS